MKMCLQMVLKTFVEELLKGSLEDALRVTFLTSWRRPLQIILKTTGSFDNMLNI